VKKPPKTKADKPAPATAQPTSQALRPLLPRSPPSANTNPRTAKRSDIGKKKSRTLKRIASRLKPKEVLPRLRTPIQSGNAEADGAAPLEKS
jgi:hypothetical protein